jgi:peptide chain release factor 2
MTKLNDLKKVVNKVKSFEIVDDLKESLSDIEMKELVEEEIKKLYDEVISFETITLLNGEYDKNNCILEIHSGAGGTESCDWVNMLYRMYTRWCDTKNYKYEVIDVQAGDEVGLKNVSILIKGLYAYGYLKSEKGVHRLVRISPFDSNKRRHTTFASVEVIPEFDTSINVEIKDDDLKIDVYRSSGAGGQSVNTTDSAVRITHIPTKIVVTCQNERSQLKNKEKAMQILKNKLYLLTLEKKEKEINSLRGTHMDINFGSQIRSYVMHPYSMVKDHRTNTEDTNVLSVLDGNIDKFIESFLRM